MKLCVQKLLVHLEHNDITRVVFAGDGGHVLVTEFRGIAGNGLFCADVLRPHDRDLPTNTTLDIAERLIQLIILYSRASDSSSWLDYVRVISTPIIIIITYRHLQLHILRRMG